MTRVTDNPPPAQQPDNEPQTGVDFIATGPTDATAPEKADALTNDEYTAAAERRQERDQTRAFARLLWCDLAATERYVRRVRQLARTWAKTDGLRSQDVAELRQWPLTAQGWPFDEHRTPNP
jgi:hypothetical protein